MSLDELKKAYPPTGEGFRRLIQVLESEGMTLDEFNSLRPQKTRETFRGMERYCSKPGLSFMPNSNNRKWQINLLGWLADRQNQKVTTGISLHAESPRPVHPNRTVQPDSISEKLGDATSDDMPDIEESIFEDREFMTREMEVARRDSSFRKNVLRHLGPGCAVCSVSVSALVQAAHIVPVKEGGSDSLANGLPLCANHHLAFDRYLWSIDPKTMKIVAPPGIDLRCLGIERDVISIKPSQDALASRHSFFLQAIGVPSGENDAI